MRASPKYVSRDPVCEAIESLLRELENQGKGHLSTSDVGDNVRVQFGDLSAEGNTHDIALVRLASAMVDDARYCALLMSTLRKSMHTEDLNHK